MPRMPQGAVGVPAVGQRGDVPPYAAVRNGSLLSGPVVRGGPRVCIDAVSEEERGHAWRTSRIDESASAQRFQACDGVQIAGVERERTFVVYDRLRPVTKRHVGFAEAVVRIGGVRILGHVALKHF